MPLIYYHGTFHIPNNNCSLYIIINGNNRHKLNSLTCYFTLYAETILIKVARLWNTWINKISGLHTKWSSQI